MTRPKGFLKTSEGIYPLSPKITTIGREGCDFLIQNQSVDQQHATIEFCDVDTCFVLKDLDSSQGTYVNDCRVQNAAVRVAAGDLIRFGFTSSSYEFVIEQQSQSPQTVYPPVTQRSSWQQPTPITSYSTIQPTNGLPSITTTISGLPPPIPAWVSGSSTQLPRPPPSTSRLGRPLSAGSARRGPTPSAPPPAQSYSSSASPVMRGGWVSGPIRYDAGATTQEVTSSSDTSAAAMHEKEKKIISLQSELERLQRIEYEASQKDQTVDQLQQQNYQLQSQLNNLADPNLRSRLAHLENEISDKKGEVAQLRDQISRCHSEPSQVGPGEAGLRQELTMTQAELNAVRMDVNKAHKDKQITSGLVTQLQRDMASKDATISRLTREIEALKKDVTEKDITISAVQAKFSRIKDSKKTEDESEARERELISIRQKFKAAEAKIQDQSDLVKSMKQEIESHKLGEQRARDGHRKAQSELEECRSQLTDMQRTERIARVDMQEATKKYERFRSRIMQIAFSTPGVRAPEEEVKDDQLLEMIRRVVEERTEFHRKIGDMKSEVEEAGSAKNELTKAVAKFNNVLSNSANHLNTNGRLSNHIRDQISILTAQPVDEFIQPIKDVLLLDLQHQLQWQQDIEAALEKCGINIKLSSEATASHITSLLTKWEGALTERDTLKTRLSEVEADYRNEMDKLSARLEGENEAKVEDATARAKTEAEETLRHTIDEILAAETEKRENAREADLRKIEELSDSIAQLQKSLMERQDDDNEKLRQAEIALADVAEKEKVEADLRAELAEAIAARDEVTVSVAEQLRTVEQRSRGELDQYKEQARQHAKTICAMEERLNKVMKQNKDLQKQLNDAKKAYSDLKNQPTQKNRSNHGAGEEPVVVVHKPTAELAALERSIVALRQENASLKKQLEEKDDIIIGLRRDVAGASARLSDIQGELTDAQKEELETNRRRWQQAEADLTETRRCLAKMTEVVDALKCQVSDKDSEITKLRQVLTTMKTTLTERDQQITDLETKMAAERDQFSQQLAQLEEEGRITSELTALGAQCRGERHDQIISHQKEALSELRKRTKALEQVRSPAPSSDQAVQQVVLLKKELAEMRANQAVSETRRLAPNLGGLAIARVTTGATHADGHQSVELSGEKRTGLFENRNAIDDRTSVAAKSGLELDMERSAHRETMDCLEGSEATFLTLLRAMASNLEMESIQGLRNMAHLPRDERDKLREERETACHTLAQRVMVLKERLMRKEELLLGYEQDLAKLKQAEELAARKEAQVEGLVREIRMKTEEIELLRESLNRTKDMLNQEKRVNTAIKTKKPIYIESEGRSSPKPKYHCPPEDVFGKDAARTKSVKEKLKRKDYEIQTLKSELAARERDLCQATTRVVNMETSLGFKPDDPEKLGE